MLREEKKIKFGWEVGWDSYLDGFYGLAGLYGEYMYEKSRRI